MAKWFAEISLYPDDNPRHILYRLEESPEPLTDDAFALKGELESAESRIRSSFGDTLEFSNLLRELFDCARVGLAGDKPQPKLAQQTFQSFRTSVIRSAEKYQKKLINAAAKSALLLLIAAIVFGLLLSLAQHNFNFDIDIPISADRNVSLYKLALSLSYALASIAIGVLFVAFLGAQKATTFETFDIGSEGIPSPGLNVLYSIIVLIILDIALLFDIVQLGLGPILQPF